MILAAYQPIKYHILTFFILVTKYLLNLLTFL